MVPDGTARITPVPVPMARWSPHPPFDIMARPLKEQAAYRVGRLRVPQQVLLAAEAMRHRDTHMLSLEAAERLFWSGGNQEALAGMDLETRCPAPEVAQPGPSALLRCPNCREYGFYRSTERGNECASCSWLQPESALRFPALVSPRVTAEAKLEQRRLLVEVRALHRRAYVKPRKQERPLGWQAGLPLSLVPPWEAKSARPRCGVAVNAAVNAASASAAGGSAAANFGGEGSAEGGEGGEGGARTATSAFASPRGGTSLAVPLPWLAGRATPPPYPPPPPKPPTPPAGAGGGFGGSDAAAAAAARAARPPSPWTLETSIWSPRRKWSDSKSLYDTEVTLARAIGCDWGRAMEEGLVKHVTTSYAGGR